MPCTVTYLDHASEHLNGTFPKILNPKPLGTIYALRGHRARFLSAIGNKFLEFLDAGQAI